MWIEPRCLRSESECGEVEGVCTRRERKRGKKKREREREQLDQKRQTGLWLGDDTKCLE
jgi:hypothetical protein